MNGIGTGAPWNPFFSAPRFALFLALLIAVCFAPVLLGFQSFVSRDFGMFGYPLAYYFRESVWRGELPLWNPLSNCGLPFMAQWNTMVFYPGSLIYLLLPLPWSLNLFCLLHLYLGGMGMYFLARSWTHSNFPAAFAGLVFSFNGLALHSLMWPSVIAALGWMPCVLLLVQRACHRGGLWLSGAILAGTCQFMTGGPEVFLVTWVAAGFLWLAEVDSHRSQVQRFAIRILTIVFGISFLSAVQLLPVLELIQQSQRTSGYDSGGWAMPAWGWANLLVPLFRTASSSGVAYQLGQAWVSSYYFGIATLWLAVLAVVMMPRARTWILGGLVLLALVLALGESGFVWPLLKHYIAPLGFIRYPVKLVFLLAAPLPLLAALGLAKLEDQALRADSDAGQTTRRTDRFVKRAAAVLTAAIAMVLWINWRHPLPGQNTAAIAVNGVMRVVFFGGLVVGVFWIRRGFHARRIVLLAWLLLAVMDLLTHTPWQNPTVSPSVLTPGLETLESLRERATLGKVRAMPSLKALQYFHTQSSTNAAQDYLGRRTGQSQDLNLLERIPKADGFFPLYISRQQEVQYRIFPNENSVHPTIADVMAVGEMTAPGKLFEWVPRTNALPMISAGQQPVFVSEGAMLATLLYSNFNPQTALLLPTEAAATTTATRQPGARVSVERFKAREVTFKVTTPGEAVVSISQTFYRPWRAYVDDHRVQLWRANHAFQAVVVPAGEHQVRLDYEDSMFLIGAWISGATLALLAMACAFKRSRRRVL